MSPLVLASPENFRSNPVNPSLSLSRQNVAKEHSVSRQQVFSWNWKAKQDTLLKTYEKRSATARHVSGAGRPSLIPDGAKERLLSFFDEREAANFSVSPKMLYYDGANPTNKIRYHHHNCPGNASAAVDASKVIQPKPKKHEPPHLANVPDLKKQTHLANLDGARGSKQQLSTQARKAKLVAQNMNSNVVVEKVRRPPPPPEKEQ
eukprot:scaffold8162_cov183-Amphora_coffeaeformis.AAC.5